MPVDSVKNCEPYPGCSGSDKFYSGYFEVIDLSEVCP